MPSRKKARKGGTSRPKLKGPRINTSSEGENVPVRRTRGKRGRLQDMPNLPLDVLIEIFGYLHPKDLLNLSRTSRDFRSFLMSRDNLGLWRAARANVPGLPECPPFLSEPEYTNIVFFPQCTLCSKTAQHNNRVFIMFKARYCKECEAKMLVSRAEDDEVDKFLRKVEDFVNKNYHKGEDEDIRLPFLATLFSPRKYLRSQVVDFRARWIVCRSKEAHMALIDEENLKHVDILTWTDEYYAWAHGKSSERSAELSQLRADRIDAIMDRLRREGWAEEMALHENLKYRLRREKFATKPAALTDSAWQRIREEANAWIRATRDRRLHDIRVKILQPRFLVFEKYIANWVKKFWPASEDDDDEPIVPSAAITVNDWLLMPAVQCLLERLDDTKALTDLDINHSFPNGQFYALASEWYLDRQADLVDILMRALDLDLSLDDVDDVLALAMHAFDCTKCDERFMTFPEIILHRCGHWHQKVEASVPDYRKIATYYGDRYPWDPKNVRVNPRVFPDKARALIRTLGLNPNNATHAAMSKCRTRLTCSDCGPVSHGKYEVFDWKRALHHQDSEKHFSESRSCSWVVLPSEVAERVREFEASMRPAEGKYPYMRWVDVYSCRARRCYKWFMYHEPEKLYAHLLEEHGVAEGDAKEGEDYSMKPVIRGTMAAPHVYFSHSPSGDIVVTAT